MLIGLVGSEMCIRDRDGCVHSCADCGWTGSGGSQVSGGAPQESYNYNNDSFDCGAGFGGFGYGGYGCPYSDGYGAGGGGGYFGGGGASYEGAGGGSSFAAPEAFNVAHQQGVREGNGFVIGGFTTTD